MSDDIELVQVNGFELLKHALTNLGIHVSISHLNSIGSDALSIEDMNGNEVQFVFGKHGDEYTKLQWWEVWKA